MPMSICEEPSMIGDNASLLRLYWEISPFIMTVIVTLLYMKGVERRNNISCLISKRPVLDTILGILLGTAWMMLVVILGMSTTILELGPARYIQNIVIWGVAILFNVAMQEILVRGYLFSLLKREYHISLAVMVTSVLFTLMHGGAFEVGPIAVLNVFTTSILLSLVLIISKGLLLPILMHFMWNLLGSFLGIVSLAQDYPSLYSATLSGNDLLSGGSAGIEGSMIVLVINSLVISGLLMYVKKIKIAHSDF